MCLVFAQGRKTPGIGIGGECGARTLKTRERIVRCESRHCRRIGGIKGRSQGDAAVLKGKNVAAFWKGGKEGFNYWKQCKDQGNTES